MEREKNSNSVNTDLQNKNSNKILYKMISEPDKK